ncbi:hypothetical protein [Cellulosimicrobium cellulans]|uniref:Uncharacterized protein n=1 Tax=Cellulosimicrobium cellulans TaxID=1710 RepID=A0A4Y4E2Q4_CELCE|nr:hypothetical protein [Cellulosimicrobium cellulans]GED11666.1 hypothetical protein CCE02nite_36650 [Cellulosimicrobium cellulans]
MITLFRRKTFLDRVRESLGHQRKRPGSGAVRPALVTLGSLAAVTAASAAVSAIRTRQEQGAHDDRG